MGLNFRKSISILPGVKVNLSKGGVSLSGGVKGLRKSINTKGQTTTTVSIPGTGIYYTDRKKITNPFKSKDDKKENYESRAETVEEFIGYIEEFERGYTADDGNVLQSFLTNVALFSQADSVDEENGCVNLMTLHAAKGLEFPTVFLCGRWRILSVRSTGRFFSSRLSVCS